MLHVRQIIRSVLSSRRVSENFIGDNNVYQSKNKEVTRTGVNHSIYYFPVNRQFYLA